MRSVECSSRKKYFGIAVAVAEGLWNGAVVSGVLTISAFLIKRFWLIY